jgi:hypothetical protein
VNVLVACLVVLLSPLFVDAQDISQNVIIDDRYVEPAAYMVPPQPNAPAVYTVPLSKDPTDYAPADSAYTIPTTQGPIFTFEQSPQARVVEKVTTFGTTILDRLLQPFMDLTFTLLPYVTVIMLILAVPTLYSFFMYNRAKYAYKYRFAGHSDGDEHESRETSDDHAVVYKRTNQSYKESGAQSEGERAVPVEPKRESKRWESVLAHANTSTPNDWRIAILDADIMLDDLLTKKGYIGASVGEKLKQVHKSDWLALDAAWDAHKVRNEIAHGGLKHQLNEREVRRVISLYEAVFREQRYI